MSPDYDSLVQCFILECPEVLTENGLCYGDDPQESALLRGDWYACFLGWCLFRQRLPVPQVVTALSNAMKAMQYHASSCNPMREVER